MGRRERRRKKKNKRNLLRWEREPRKPKNTLTDTGKRENMIGEAREKPEKERGERGRRRLYIEKYISSGHSSRCVNLIKK